MQYGRFIGVPVMLDCCILGSMSTEPKAKLTLLMSSETWVDRAKRAARNRGVSLSALVEQLLNPVIAEEEAKILAELQQSLGKSATK